MKLRETFFGFLHDCGVSVTAGVMDALIAAQTQPGSVAQTGGSALADYEKVSDEQAAAIAKQLGVDPSTIQVVKAPKGFNPADGTTGQNERMVKVRSGEYVAWKDIPKGPDGNPTQEWVDENCDCEDHQAKRAASQKSVSTDRKLKAMDNGYI